jgi:hypothetical protein
VIFLKNCRLWKEESWWILGGGPVFEATAPKSAEQLLNQRVKSVASIIEQDPSKGCQ